MGVATRLKEYNPQLRTTHCAAHRLSLACVLTAEMDKILSVGKKVINLLKVSNFYTNNFLCGKFLKEIRLAAGTTIHLSYEF